MSRFSNKCARGKGGFTSLFHVVRSWSALPQHSRWASMLASLPFLTVVLLLLLTGCRSFSERYVARRPNLDPKTREAILQHRVIVGMSPDEAIAATAGHRQPYAYAVNPDTGVIDINFWTRTQFDTTNLVGFKVVFTNGTTASIARLPKWKDTQ